MGPLEDYRNAARQHLAFFHASACQEARWQNGNNLYYRVPKPEEDHSFLFLHPRLFASDGPLRPRDGFKMAQDRPKRGGWSQRKYRGRWAAREGGAVFVLQVTRA